MNTRDENDGSEGNDRNNKNEYNTRHDAATSRDAIIFNDEDDAAKDEPRSELERRPYTATSRDNQNIGDTPTAKRNDIEDDTNYSPERGEIIPFLEYQ